METRNTTTSKEPDRKINKDDRSPVRTASPRGERRLEAILKAATRAFLKHGYTNTSIDAIVTRSGGSKATVYKHFRNKRELFNAVIDHIVTNKSNTTIDADDPDPGKALMNFARQRVEVVFSPDHIALIRLVIAEGPNSPDIAEAYYEHGPAQSYRTLSEYFRIQNKRGKLKIDDPDEAAYQFSALLMHRWYLRKLTGYAHKPTSKEVEKGIRAAVNAFMRIYSP